MPPKLAVAPLMLLALVVTSPWNCSSHEAIVLLLPADAGPVADATSSLDRPTSAPTDTTTSAPTDTTTSPPSDATTTKDVTTSPPSDTITRAPTDATESPPADATTRPPTDATVTPPTDVTERPPADATTTKDATTSPGLPFLDEFADGWASHWSLSSSEDGPISDVSDGSLAMVTLDATDYSYSRLRCNRDGSLFSDSDVTASMRFRVDQAPISTQLVRLDVRQARNTENIFYAVGAKVDKDGSTTKVGIYKKVDKQVEAGEKEYTICSLAETKLTTPVPMAQWHTLKLIVSGTNAVSLTAFFDDEEMATVVDDCDSKLEATDGAIVPNGGCLADQTGLGIQVEAGIKAAVDWVLVTAP